MPDGIDEELALGLRQARKKPRNFALLAKGASVQKFMVSKKPIKPGDVQKAKAEYKANLVYKGVVQGDGSDLIFKVVGDEPTIKLPSLREYIADKCGLKLKPRFEVVSELQEIDDTDETPESEGYESPSSSSDPLTSEAPTAEPSSQTPPESPPVPGGNETGTDLIAGLVATMKSLAPHVQSLIGKDPSRKDALLGLVAEFQKHVKSRDAATAKTALTSLAQLIKQGAGTATAPAKVQAGPAFWTEWEKAKADWRDAIDAVNGQLAKLGKELAASDDAELKRIAEFGLNAITADHRVPLQAAIIEVDQARSGDPAKAITHAKECVVEFRDHIDTDERVEACDDNPFEVKVTIRESLDRALASMEQALGKALAG